MLGKRRYVGILAAALILAMAVAGVALATQDPQAKPAKANHFQDFLEKFADNLGVDQDKVKEALEATRKQMLDQAVQQGGITKEQADEIAGRPFGSFGWFGDFSGKKHDGKAIIRVRANDETAKILGLTPDQLKSEIESGKKLPEIIADHGLTAEQFHQKMLEIKKEALAKAVSEGKLSQEQADKMIQRIKQRFDNPAPAPEPNN